MLVHPFHGGMASVNAVRTTGIYCRSDCAARPDPRNVTRMRSPAEAEASGYRPCLRCRPDRLPVVPIPGEVADVVAAALAAISDGVLDHADEAYLASGLGISSRHLRRLFRDHVGATPTQVALSRRAHFARVLLDDTDLPITDIAFASGFGSVRRFNEVLLDTFRFSPRELRRRRRRGDRNAVDGGIRITQHAIRPVDFPAVLGALAANLVPGVESVDGGRYRRSANVCGHSAVVDLTMRDEHTVEITAHLPSVVGLIDVIGRCRRLLDLDRLGDPMTSPTPSGWSAFEEDVRRCVADAAGAEATLVLARLAESRGTAIDGAEHLGIRYEFPSPDDIASRDAVGLPFPHAEAIHALARHHSALDASRR